MAARVAISAAAAAVTANPTAMKRLVRAEAVVAREESAKPVSRSHLITDPRAERAVTEVEEAAVQELVAMAVSVAAAEAGRLAAAETAASAEVEAATPAASFRVVLVRADPSAATAVANR
jgi:hypothetical protein